MKKAFLLLLSVLMLCSCNSSANTNTAETSASESGTVVETTIETAVETTIETTLETTTETEPKPMIDNPDVRNLKWGMSVDEVKKYEHSELFKEEVEESETTGQIQTMLTYRNVEILDYTANLKLCVVDGIGLDGVNYHISSKDAAKTYQEIHEYLVEEIGKPDVSYDGEYATWHDFENEQTIMLLNNEPTVQFSYFRLFESAKKEKEAAEREYPVEVKLVNKSVLYKDTDEWRFSDHVLFEFEVVSKSEKDIKGVSGVATFKDMFGDEIIKVKCDFTDTVTAGTSIVDDSLSLEVNQFMSDHTKLRDTDFDDLQFMYIPTKIVYADGSVDEY